jgi:hypothetical protein
MGVTSRYKLKDIIEEIRLNPLVAYANLKKLIAAKPKRNLLDLAGCLGELTSKEKSIFLGNIAQYLKGTDIGEVDLSKNNLDAANLSAFVRNLKAPKKISINAEDNNLSDIGMLSLSKSLQGKKVISLSLNRNKIGDKGIIDFGRYQKKNNLASLSLDENQFSSSALAAFSKNLSSSKLIKLKIGAMSVHAPDAAAFAKNIKTSNIENLDVSSCELGDSGFIELIKNLAGSKVKFINACNNLIDDIGAKIAGNYFDGTNIEDIKLSDNYIGTQGVCDLIYNSRFSKLHTFDIRYSKAPKGHDLSLIAKVLKGTPITRAEFDLHSSTKYEEELVKYILKENASSSFNLLSRRYLAAKKFIKPFDYTFFQRKIDWLLMFTFFMGGTITELIILGLTGLTGLPLVAASVALGVLTAATFYVGLNLFDFAKKFFTSTDKQKYKVAYEKERENALAISKDIGVQNKDILLSFAKAFDDAPHQKFNVEGKAIGNNPAIENKLQVLRAQSVKLRELVPQTNRENNSKYMSTRMR